MSVLTQSEVDIAQTQKYKQMVGLTNFLSITGGTIMVASCSIQSDLFVSGNSNFNGTSTILGSLYISGNTLFSNSMTINSNLFDEKMSSLIEKQNSLIRKTPFKKKNFLDDSIFYLIKFFLLFFKIKRRIISN